MPTLQEQLQAAVVQTTTDSGLLHTIVHGDANTTVTTEGGPVKSIAKVIGENQALLTTSLSTLTEMRDQAVASADAAAFSEDAAHASQTAAADSESAAATSAANALASENEAEASAAQATNAAEAAEASQNAAGLSEAAAAASETAASLSATEAATSATTAVNAADAASLSATNANASAVDAAASAAAAASSAAGQLYSDVIDLTFADSPFTVPPTANGHLYRVNTSGGNVQVNLPNLASLAADFRLGVAKATGDANTVTVNRAGSDTINGLTSRTLSAQYNIDTFIGDRDNLSWLASGGGLGAVNIVVQRFNGTGSQTVFSLSGSPGSENNTNIYISGVYQQKDTYDLVGNQLTFSSAPPIGTNNIEVAFGAQAPIGVPSDNAVNTQHLQNGAVTLGKLAPGTPNKLLGFNGAGAVAEVDPPQAFLPGMLMPYAGSAAPSGWLLCAGQAVSRTTFAGLFAILGTVYGSGDGSTTFNLPDLRGRMPVGLDNMGGTSANRITAAAADIVGGSGGVETRTPAGSIAGTTGDTTLTISQIPAHGHPQTWRTSWNNSLTTMMVGSDGQSGCVNAQIGAANGGLSSCGYATNEANMVFTQNRGGGGAHNHPLSATFSGSSMDITQPWIAMNYIIKT